MTARADNKIETAEGKPGPSRQSSPAEPTDGVSGAIAAAPSENTKKKMWSCCYRHCCCHREEEFFADAKFAKEGNEKEDGGQRRYLTWVDIDATGTRGNKIGVGTYGIITKYIIGDDNVVAAVKDMWLFQDDVSRDAENFAATAAAPDSDAEARRKRDFSKHTIVGGETLRELALVRSIPKTSPQMLVGALFFGLVPDGRVRLAMPFVDGGGAFGHFQGTTLERKMKWARRMFACLACAHELGIAHGDIKPENFLLDTATDDLLLADFGLSASVGVPPCRRRDNLYAVHFRPPEFFGYESCDIQDIERGDIWACGASAYVVFVENYPEWARGANRAFKNLDMTDARAVARAEKTANSVVFRGLVEYFGLPTEETWPRECRPGSLRAAFDQLTRETTPAPARVEVRSMSAPLLEDEGGETSCRSREGKRLLRNFQSASAAAPATRGVTEDSECVPAWVLLLAHEIPIGAVRALKRATHYDPTRRASASDIVEDLALASADRNFSYSSPTRQKSISSIAVGTSAIGVLADSALPELESRIAAPAYSAFARAVVANAEWIWNSLDLTFTELIERPHRACAVDSVLALATARLAHGENNFVSAERLAERCVLGAWLVWDATSSAHPLRAYRYAKIAASQLMLWCDERVIEDCDAAVVIEDGKKKIATDISDVAEERLRQQLAKAACECLSDLDFRIARPTPRACAVSLAHTSLLPVYAAIVDSSIEDLARASVNIQCDRDLAARYTPSQLGAAILEDFLNDQIAARMFSAETGHRGQFLSYAQAAMRSSNQWTINAAMLTPVDREFIRRRRDNCKNCRS